MLNDPALTNIRPNDSRNTLQPNQNHTIKLATQLADHLGLEIPTPTPFWPRSLTDSESSLPLARVFRA